MVHIELKFGFLGGKKTDQGEPSEQGVYQQQTQPT